MSDSSSEDEISEQLLESIDKSFMNDILYAEMNTNCTKIKETEQVKTKLPPSLRRFYCKDDQFTLNGLTEANKKFIAERLSKSLDNSFKETYINKKYDRYSLKKCDEVTGGILLFSNSSEYVTVDQESSSVSVRKRSKVKNEKVNRVDEMKRCKTVAVNSDWILSGSATKGWCRNTKSELIQVKCINKEDSGILNCELRK
ncbi:uncharacterized protein LOC142327740 [Lycorma delicatula]|uniref:uncharacterized protein LOC142327740 n=1 Tax=Lycorma delicatula TaxID=130591 RepID=UPI003F51096A